MKKEKFTQGFLQTLFVIGFIFMMDFIFTKLGYNITKYLAVFMFGMGIGGFWNQFWLRKNKLLVKGY